MQDSRRNMRILLLTAVLVFMVRWPHSALAQECELNCKTKNCSAEGTCICNIPGNDSLTTGDRNFLGGTFCDVPSVMCNGTNSFWCEAGGVCNELVEGKNYTCTCTHGFAGDHCNFRGLLCGDTYCYNGGGCRVNGIDSGSCDCPPQFLGAKDCSLLTPTAVSSAPAPAVSIHGQHHKNGGITITKIWWIPLGAVLAVILLVSCVAGLALTWHRQRVTKLSQMRFQELRQLQTDEGPDFYDDGEDPFSDHKNNSGRAFP